MKILNLVAWLAIAELVVGCAVPQTVSSQTVTSQTVTSQTVSSQKLHDEVPPHSCPYANPGLVTVTINFRANDIVVAPSTVNAAQGDVIQFIMVGSDGAFVQTEGTTADAAWLLGGAVKTPGNQRFFVCVPRNLIEPDRARRDPQSKDFKYNVKATGHPTLDPVVRVSEW